MIVAPYNAHVAAIERAFAAAGLETPFVGTVDKFQGQERPVSIYAMGTSAPEDAPRGMEFLYSLNRLNVATSRARCVAAVVCSPALLRVGCRTPRQMQLANGLCLAVEAAEAADGRRSRGPPPDRRGPRPDRLTYRGGRMTATVLSPAALDRARRRSRSALFAGVALGSTGHIAAVTVATIVAKDLLGSQTLAGAPGATVVLGAALGAVLLSALMARRGRRIGLVTGYSVGVLGALVATAAVVTRSFPLLLLGTVLIGFGNASNQLSRYTAADMVPPERRASAIGLVVWAATIGSVVGPWLVPIASDMAGSVGLPAARRPVPRAGGVRRPRSRAVVRDAAARPVRPSPTSRPAPTPTAEPAVLGPVRDILRRPARGGRDRGARRRASS